MIKFVYLDNFRSYRDTRIDFVPGINALVGPSCNGKSNIIKGIEWVRTNTPSGKSHISFWNRLKTGEPKEPTIAGLGIEDGWEVVRSRSEEFNGYLLYQFNKKVQEFEALRGKVPEEVTRLLHLSDVNVQRQRDVPFLLGGSDGEAARFFNRIVRTDLIDKMLSAAESKHRSIKADIQTAKSKAQEYHQKISQFKWVDEASSKLETLSHLSKRVEENTILFEQISGLIDEIETQNNIVQKVKFIDRADQILTQIEQKNKRIYSYRKEQKQLKNIVAKYNETMESFSEIDLDTPLALIVKIEKLNKRMDDHLGERDALQRMVGNMEFLEKGIKECEERMAGLIKKLPKTCPTCGAPLKKEEFLNGRRENC